MMGIVAVAAFAAAAAEAPTAAITATGRRSRSAANGSPTACKQSARASRTIETRNNRIGTNGFLNQRFDPKRRFAARLRCNAEQAACSHPEMLDQLLDHLVGGVIGLGGM
jgi:hypothetical protein